MSVEDRKVELNLAIVQTNYLLHIDMDIEEELVDNFVERDWTEIYSYSECLGEVKNLELGENQWNLIETLYYKYYYQQVKVSIFRFLPFVFMKKLFSVQWGLLNNVEKCCIYSNTWLCWYLIHLECVRLWIWAL